MPRKPRSQGAPSVEARLAALERKFKALDATRSADASAAKSPAATSPEMGVMQLLTERASRAKQGPHATGTLIVGGVVSAGARKFADLRLSDVAESVEDPGLLADALGALASAPRLVLLRRLLASDATRSELLRELQGTSAGQLYHHINELRRTGLILQLGRGSYRVNPERVLPLLALLGVASILSGTPAADQG